MDEPNESSNGDTPTAPLPGPPSGGPSGSGWQLIAPPPPAAPAPPGSSRTAAAPPNPADTVTAPPPAPAWDPPTAWAPPAAPTAPTPAAPPIQQPPGSAPASPGARLLQVARDWKILAGVGAGGLVVLLIGVLVMNSLVSSADSDDLEAGRQAFSVADCDKVRGHADSLDGRWRPPWMDRPDLAGQVGGCSTLDAALTGTPSAQVVALAELRADTGHPSIRTAANDHLQELLASPELAEGADAPLCDEISSLQNDAKITPADHPFAALRRCGLRLAGGSDDAIAVSLFDRALAMATPAEVPTLSGDPAVVGALMDSPETCRSLDTLAPVLGAQGSAKYATCADAAMTAGNEDAAVELYLDLGRLYPQSAETAGLGPRLLGQPGLCPASAPTASLPFATSPDWAAGHKLACGRGALEAREWLEAEGYLQEAVAQGAGTQPAIDAAALLEAMRPASGTVLGEPTIKLTGRIGLEVNNNTADDTVIGVLSDSGPALRFYVRAGETTQVRKFPVGDYRLFVLQGSRWLPDEAAFVTTVEVSELSELFDVPAGYVGKTTLTLDAGPLGNVTSAPAPCKDLVAAGLPATGDCTGPA